MLGRLRWAARQLSDSVTTTGKIMGIVLALTLFFGLGLTIYVRISTRLLLVEQLESRGLAIAEGVATRSVEPVLMGNTVSLHALLEETREVNRDVRYVLTISPRGEVLGDTFRRHIPAGLVEANAVGPRGEMQIRPLRTDEGIVRDIAVPLFGGQAGVVRVGMSEQALAKELNQQTVRMLLATLLVSLLGLWVSYRLSEKLVRPILALVTATERVTAGDLICKAPVYARDEIGRLAMAFNTMTDRLAQQYAAIQNFNQQILRDNAELVALSELTTHLNRLYDIDTLPRVASRLVKNRLELDDARILLWHGEREQLDPQPGPEVTDLAWAALCSLQVSVSTDGRQAAVPLLTGEQPLGVLVVQGGPARFQSERDRNFLQSVANHLTVALQNAHLLSELTEKQLVLTHLFDRAVSAQEEERRRIARELHDETSQSLTLLMLGLRSVETSTSPEQLQQNLRVLRERLVATLESVHQMARRLRPPALDDLGLKEALFHHVRELAEQTGLDIDLDVEGLGAERLPPEVEIVLYRIVQEAVANAIRHSHADEISVVLERQGTMAIAVVEDNGLGFDPAAVNGTTRLGICGMRERARLVGGTLTIESTPGTGTTVMARIPLTGKRG